MSEKRSASPAKRGTWDADEGLPQLPVPDVRDTLSRLRESCIGAGATAEQLGEFDRLAAIAETELQDAQRVLQERQKTLPNYIGPWWDEFAYLRGRDPIVLSSNVFAVRDSDFNSQGQPRPPIRDRFRRAAMLSQESLAFRKMLVNGTLPAESQGRARLCMDQFKRYYCVRVPGKEVDSWVVTPAVETRFIHVMYRGASFVVKAVADDGHRYLNYAEMLACIKHGCSKLQFPAMDECVGTMTAANRTAWHNTWQALVAASLQNADNLKLITTSLTTICIDDKPITSLRQGINRGAHGQFHNRWYDRSSLRIVGGNGIVVENGEHSPMDAIVSASTPIDAMIIAGKKALDAGVLDEPVGPQFNPAAYVRILQWDLTPEIRASIRRARREHMELVKTTDIDTYAFNAFGRNLLREWRVNADAFVQQALQLAFFRDRGYLAPVYETASTRMFKHGRTDTIRSLTAEQRALITAVDNPKIPVEEKRELLRKAIAKHAAVTNLASTGRGIDRHLMTLKLAQSLVLKKPLPQLFSLPIVAQSGSFTLLTSQMIGRLFVGGFAHVYPDGYGCCYYLRPNAICIIVSGCTKGQLTNVARFKENITAALATLAELAKPVTDGEDVPPQQDPLVAKQGSNERPKSKL